MRENDFNTVMTRALAILLAASLPAGGSETLPEPVRQMLASHCTDCHDADVKKGGVDLDFESLDLHSPASATLLERMHRALATDEMPPAKKARPEAAAKSAVLSWLDDTLVRKVPRHAAGLRRLTRVEYENTISKVFGIPFKVSSGFPADTSSHGFDNVAVGSDATERAAEGLQRNLGQKVGGAGAGVCTEGQGAQRERGG